jgi:hypothetical protein
MGSVGGENVLEAVAGRGERLAVDGPLEAERIAIGIARTACIRLHGEGCSSRGFGEVEASDRRAIAAPVNKPRDLAVRVIPPLVAILDEVERAVGSDF